MRGRVDGAFGEITMLPGMRLPFRRLLLFGVGESERFDEPRFVEAVQGMRRAIKELRATRYALALPGRPTGLIMARRALELWTESGETAAEVWLIEPPAAQKEMSEGLGKAHARR